MPPSEADILQEIQGILLGDQAGALVRRIEALEVRVRESVSMDELERLSMSLERAQALTAERLGGIESDLQERLTDAQARLESLQASAQAKLVVAAEGLGSRTDAHEGRLADLGEALDALETAQKAEVSSLGAQIQDSVRGLQEALAKGQAEMHERLQASVRGLETSITESSSDARARIADLRGETERRHEAVVASVHSELAGLTTHLDDSLARARSEAAEALAKMADDQRAAASTERVQGRRVLADLLKRISGELDADDGEGAPPA